MLANKLIPSVQQISFVGESGDAPGGTTTQINIDLTGIGFSSGDIGLFFLWQSGGDTTPGINLTMTELYNTNGFHVNAMTMDGTETAATTATLSSGYKNGAFVVYRNCSAPASLGAVVATIGTASNPPSASVDAGNIVLAVSHRSNIPADSVPSGYTAVSTTTGSAFGLCTVAEKEITAAGSDNPGAFGGTVGNGVGYTIVLER